MLKQNLAAALMALAMATCVLPLSGPAHAQRPSLSQPVTFNVSSSSQKLEMTVNTSRILTLERNVPRMLVNNTEIVRATPLSPNQVQISALRPGVTQVNVWDENDRVFTVDVTVSADVGDLERLLAAEFPEASLTLRPTNTSVIITGYVPSAEMVGAIVRIAEDYYPRVINRITVGGVQQVLLKTKVMEVSRTKLRRLGIDWATVNGNDFFVQNVGGLVNAAAAQAGGIVGTGADTVRFGIIGDNAAFVAYIDALRRNDLIKVMAEPSLVTISGRPATFNAGGEFPIIVPQSLGTVSIQYREFGTRVDFVPIVLGNGNIRLEVRPQVSEIDPSRSVTINGIDVPALRNRGVDTAVEMRAGQTMALGGLLQERVSASNRGVPYLADVPWVGAAFRHVREEINEVELLIMVTPEFVDAMNPEEVPPCGPGQATESPCDADLYFRGYLEVPKGYGQSCDGNNCSHTRFRGRCNDCEAGVLEQPESIGPGVIVPGPHAVGATGGGARATTARRPSQPVRPQNPTSRNTATSRPAMSAESGPTLIGPIGYDVLK